VRAQRERDEQTVAIGMTLSIFVVVFLSVELAGWLLHSLSDAVDDHVGAIYGAAVLIAGVAACSHLVRSTRR
jgi:hypothetical protein